MQKIVVEVNPDGGYIVSKTDLDEAFHKASSIRVLPDPKKFPNYKEGDIIDEDQTVRWNREEVARRREARSAETLRLRKISSEAWVKFRDVVIKYIKQNSDATDKQASIIYMRAWDEGHSTGFDQFYDYLDDYIDFFIDITEAENEN